MGLELGADDYTQALQHANCSRASNLCFRHRGARQPATGAHQRVALRRLDTGFASRNLVSPQQVVVSLSARSPLAARIPIYPVRVLSRDRLMDLTVGREAGPLDRGVDVQVTACVSA